MAGNFDFLKKKDLKLFNIINDGERLFRDGYFEQTILQTRKFAENICRTTLGIKRTTEETFDEMLSTLKDILGENEHDREFIDDLYFLKKHGNFSAHNSAVEQGSDIALECLNRAFELSINYAIKNGFANKKILNSHFSIDLLMTGKKPAYSEQYQEIKERENTIKAEKTIEIDFKNKKRINKKQPARKSAAKKEDVKTETKDNNTAGVSADTIAICTGIGILFILFLAIFIFIFPF